MFEYSHLIDNTKKAANDFAYYKYWVGRYRTENMADFTRMNEAATLAAGEFDASILKNLYQPFGPDIKLPTEFRHKDIVSPTIKRLQGIESTKKFKSKLVAINKEAVNRRREEERKRVDNLVVQSTIENIKLNLEKQIPPDTPERDNAIAQAVQQQTPQRIKTYMTRDHIDPAEIIGNHILNFTKKEQDVDTKFMLGAYDAFTYGKYIFYDGIEQGKAVLKKIDPRSFTYSKTTDSPFVKDFDAGTIHQYLTPAKIQEYWGDLLSEKQLKEIYALIHNGSHGASFAFDAKEPLSFTQTVLYNGNTSIDAVIYVTHTIWRASTKKGILTFIRDGVEDVDIVDESYIFNKDIGDISIMWKNVPELHECIMAGTDIIIKAGPVEGQLFNVDNLYEKDLPFKGVLLNEYNGTAKGVVDYMKPYAILYDIILYRVEDLMSKDKGNLVVMNSDIIDMDYDKWFGYAEKNGIAFYSFQDAKNIGQKDINSLVKQVDRSQLAKIDQYIQIADYIEAKSKSVIGINPQFEGEIQEREGQKNVERAVGATSLALEPMFYLMNVAKNQIMHSLLYNQITAIIRSKTKLLTYMLDDVGIMTVDLDPDLLLESQYYMFMENMAKQDKVVDILSQYAAAKVQTETLQLSALGRFLMEEDLNSALEILKAGEEAKFEQDKVLQDKKAQSDKQLEDQRQANLERLEQIKTEGKLALEDKKGEWNILQAAVVGSGFAEDKDIDKDGTPDIIEIANQFLEQQKFEHQKLQDTTNNILARKKLEIEEKKVAKMGSK